MRSVLEETIHLVIEKAKGRLEKVVFDDVVIGLPSCQGML